MTAGESGPRENPWALIFFLPSPRIMAAVDRDNSPCSNLLVPRIGNPSPSSRLLHFSMSKPPPLAATMIPRKARLAASFEILLQSVLKTATRSWYVISSCVFYFLTSSLQIFIMDRVNVHFFCGFWRTWHRLLWNVKSGGRKQRWAETVLLTLFWLPMASSLEDLARTRFPVMVSTVKLNDSVSTGDLAI